MRKVSGLLLMVLMALLLAACGSDDEASDPTAESTQPVVSTEAVEETATVETAGIATPGSIAGTTASPAASPAASSGAIASPVAVASPAASPAASPVASPVSATPEAGSAVVAAPVDDAPARTVALSGTVTLPGAENETYVVSDNGCVGIGEFSDIQAGRQVVVRNEAGTIIGVTTLEAVEAADGCAWSFGLDVPDSAFYAVSIPMVVEHVFTAEDIEQNGGEVSIPLT